jgi:hypothetical protein
MGRMGGMATQRAAGGRHLSGYVLSGPGRATNVMDAGRERGRLNPDCHSESEENIGMPTPENFELPVINPRKVGPGQPPKGGRKRGVLNAITRDLKAGRTRAEIRNGSMALEPTPT